MQNLKLELSPLFGDFIVGAWKTSTTVDPMLKAPTWKDKSMEETNEIMGQISGSQSNTAFPIRMAGVIETCFNISHGTFQKTKTQFFMYISNLVKC